MITERERECVSVTEGVELVSYMEVVVGIRGMDASSNRRRKL